MPFKESDINRENLQAIVNDLLVATNASRTTIRLDMPPDPYFPVVVEQTVPGTRSILGETNEGILQAPTFLAVKNSKKIFEQEDVTKGPAPFPGLVDIYGIRSQLLAPIIQNGEMAGMISVHYAPGTRVWTEDDYATMRNFSERVHSELGLPNPAI